MLKISKILLINKTVLKLKKKFQIFPPSPFDREILNCF